MKKIVLILGVFVTVGLIYSIVGNNEFKQESTKAQVITKEAVENTQQKKIDNVKPEDLNREQMLAAYSKLKEARKQLKVRLSRLSSRLRRAKFSPEQAKSISYDMRRGNYLLKNPKLLGAFSSAQGIESELEQLSAVDHKLDAIKQLLDEKKQQKP